MCQAAPYDVSGRLAQGVALVASACLLTAAPLQAEEAATSPYLLQSTIPFGVDKERG